MLRQTIRTFIEIKNGVVKVLHTDPMLTPTIKSKEMKGGGRDAEEGIKCRAEKGI